MAFESQPLLQGTQVILEPLRTEHFEDLYAVARDPEIWAQHPAPNRYVRENFQAFFEESLASGGALVIREAQSGAMIGATRFHGFDPENSEVEIGWTFLSRNYWGGIYNREAKSLMLEHAFRFVDRVVLLVDPTNLRSKRAVEKIGAVHVGERENGAGAVNLLYELPKGLTYDQDAEYG